MNKREKHILRIDTSNTHPGNPTFGWQVKFNRKEHYPYSTKLFSDNVYGGKGAALEQAVQYRDHLLATDYKGYELYTVGGAMVSLASNNKSGIVGVTRSSSLERSGNRHYYWQATYKLPNGKSRTKSFRIKANGELPALVMAINARIDGVVELFNHTDNEVQLEKYIKIIDEYESIISFVNKLDFDESELLTEYLRNEAVPGTTKRSLFNRRVGQHIFRKSVMEYWHHQCAMSGAKIFLVASHIKPWVESSGEEKIDPYNGLALSPNHDKAFDSGFISFDKSGGIIISDQFTEQAYLLNIKPDQRLLRYSYLHEKYMRFHRKHIFESKSF